MAIVNSLGTVTVNSSESKHVLFEVVVVVVESPLVAT